eukprot:Gregarina_sp_Poly_1__6134@NODE_323_length_9530_cov_14_322836_g275_i0_p1_GENE_NODE_323_length_9530_cov_14_322836_g275_i0NODE_323_length_9530_cov_14_322836_g275_i0_p1_ORF_typecomplete_len583_score71_85DUF2100/PF09873_9/5_1DUF2100/PF09873_9/44_NODE_323_length_9530_cov_14_322836_g275_i052026950
MRCFHNFHHANPKGSIKGKIVHLSLSCCQTTTLGFGLTCSCPFPDEMACIEEGKCKILSAMGLVKPAINYIDFAEPVAFLDVNYGAIMRTWQILGLRRKLSEAKKSWDDKTFMRKLLEKFGPLEILITAYNRLGEGPGQTSKFEAEWANVSFDSYLEEIAKEIEYSLPVHGPHYRLANTNLQSSQPSVADQTSDLLQIPPVSQAEEEVERLTAKDSGNREVEPVYEPRAPEKSGVNELPLWDWPNYQCPFAEFRDPLDSKLQLPNFTKIDMKELENGLQDFGDANFYLRQMAIAKEIDQECLEKVLRNLKVRKTSFEYSRLIGRLRFLNMGNRHLTPLIKSLVAHVKTVAKSLEDSPYLFQDFRFPPDTPVDYSFLPKSEMEQHVVGINDNVRQYIGSPRVPQFLRKRALLYWHAWPYHVAVDRSNWILIKAFISHGFSCTFIADLKNGNITKEEMKKIKERKAIVVLTENQRKQLEDRGHWGEVLYKLKSIEGIQIISGTMRGVLLGCLRAKNLEPLKRGVRCLHEGGPLIEDERTGCIPRKICVICRNVYSLEELDWVSRRNRTLFESERKNTERKTTAP